jgi:hypothetical protein
MIYATLAATLPSYVAWLLGVVRRPILVPLVSFCSVPEAAMLDRGLPLII